MIQRMRNQVTINVPDIDLNTVTGIEVTFDQKSSGVEFTYADDAIEVIGEHTLLVSIPKEDSMQFENKNVRGQVMFTRDTGVPDATKIFTAAVDELLKEEGYGD